MSRKGVELVFSVVIIGVVLLVLAVIVLQGSRSGIGDFDLFTRDNIQSASINTCASKVEGFCQTTRTSDANWGPRYPECQKYKNEIDGGDTNCPLEAGSGP